MTTKKAKTSRLPYAHATDLAEAYRELDRLFRDWRSVSPFPMRPVGDVRSLSTSSLLRWASNLEDTAATLRATVGRVHAAVHGPQSLRQCLAQLKREQKARKAA